MKYDKILAVLNKHLQDTNSDKEYHVRPKFKFNLGDRVCSVSIQASEFAYSFPRLGNMYRYNEVELGFPNFDFTDNFISNYAECKVTPRETVYPYVPLEELAKQLWVLGFMRGDE